MKLSREKSKLIKGVITLVLVGGVTVGGITMYRNVFPNVIHFNKSFEKICTK